MALFISSYHRIAFTKQTIKTLVFLTFSIYNLNIKDGDFMQPNELLHKIKEVQEVYRESAANKLLNEGWILLHIGRYTDPPHLEAVTYVLGRI